MKAKLKKNKMDYIRRSLDIVQGKIETDSNSYNHAVKELEKRKEELTPLFKECCDKGLSMQEICNETNNEWNEIILTLAKK